MKKIWTFLFVMFFCNMAMSASLISDTETEKLLDKLIAPVVRAADISESRVQIHIINDNTFNAFVRGGEDVYVYTGMLTQIKSIPEFQAVIAHELAHTIGGHVAQMADRRAAEMKRTMIVQALGIGLVAAGADAGLGLGMIAGSSGMAKQSLMAFTRDEERMADDIGLKLMMESNLDANGFVDVLEHMQELSSGIEDKINPNNINHPLTTERLQNVREKLKLENYKFRGVENMAQKKEFEMVRAKLIGYLHTSTQVLSRYPVLDNSDAAVYARTISYMVNKDLKSAKIGVTELIERDNDNPYFYELLGDTEYQMGNYNASISAYESALKHVDNAPQIETALAMVLSARKGTGDISRAITLCKKSLLSESSALTYWVLARLYTDGRSEWAMAEYYNLQNKSDMAKKYAKSARKKLDKNTPEYIKAGDLL